MAVSPYLRDSQPDRMHSQGERNDAFVLGSVWLYQVCFLTYHRAGKPLAHIKDHRSFTKADFFD